MKRLVLFCLFIAPFLASAQLVQVVHELHANLTSGEDVYRIYAELESPDDFVSAVFGSGNDPLQLGSQGGGIVNNETVETITGNQLAVNFCAFVDDYCLDSFVTIGYAGLYYWDDTTELIDGTPISLTPTEPSITAFEDSFGPADGVNLYIEDGSWMASNAPGANAQGLPFGENNRVLLAQIAVPLGDELMYDLNLQIFPNSIGANAIQYISALGIVDDQYEVDGCEFGLSYPPSCGCGIPHGCTDYSACNYQSFAGCDDGTCVFETECAPCGVMVAYGCTDSAACNYVSASNCDDGTCFYMEICPNCPGNPFYGCTDPAACNYWSLADCDNGTCALPPCFDGPDGDLNGFIDTEDLLMLIANMGCNDPICFGDLNSDGDVNVLDLLLMLPEFNSTYP